MPNIGIHKMYSRSILNIFILNKSRFNNLLAILQDYTHEAKIIAFHWHLRCNDELLEVYFFSLSCIHVQYLETYQEF